MTFARCVEQQVPRGGVDPVADRRVTELLCVAVSEGGEARDGRASFFDPQGIFVRVDRLGPEIGEFLAGPDAEVPSVHSLESRLSPLGELNAGANI